MPNIFDYIKWRGDLLLHQAPFNEIDNLILARFSYLPFDNIIDKDEIVTIAELSQRFEKENMDDMTILLKDDIKLLKELGECPRYKFMKATCYVNKIDKDAEKQFSAITIIMPDESLYVSFRGTDYTLIGWKENFNMSFKSNIPAQLDSVNYLEKIANTFPNYLRIGGHSKGGNLAIYAAAFSSPWIKNKIIEVYSNDAPGFRDDIIKKKEYKEIIYKVKSYIPQSSIIGRLLKHEEDTYIVKSTQRGIMQHDLYSWEVLGKKFVYVDGVTINSEIVDKTLKEWLANIEDEKREIVVDVLYEILKSTEIETFEDLKVNTFSKIKTILQSYKKLDEETKEEATKAIQILLEIAKNNIKKSGQNQTSAKFIYKKEKE